VYVYCVLYCTDAHCASSADANLVEVPHGIAVHAEDLIGLAQRIPRAKVLGGLFGRQRGKGLGPWCGARKRSSKLKWDEGCGRDGRMGVDTIQSDELTTHAHTTTEREYISKRR
jgi:hypothetical protein